MWMMEVVSKPVKSWYAGVKREVDLCAAPGSWSQVYYTNLIPWFLFVHGIWKIVCFLRCLLPQVIGIDDFLSMSCVLPNVI